MQTGNKVARNPTALPYTVTHLYFFGMLKLPAFVSHDETVHIRVNWINRRVLDFNNNYFNIDNKQDGRVKEKFFLKLNLHVTRL